MCVLMFFGFLRFQELADIRRCDIRVFADHFVITISASKTDQLRQGQQVYISKNINSGLSRPFTLLGSYLRQCDFSSDQSTDYLFFRLPKGSTSRPLSYSRASELAKDVFASIGLNPIDFSLHSFRAGGATQAAAAGVADRLFQRHGRWSTSAAKDGYVKDSLASLLEVTKKIYG
jgi:integrase